MEVGIEGRDLLLEGRCRYIELGIKVACIAFIAVSSIYFCTAGLFGAVLSGVHDPVQYQGSIAVIARALMSGTALVALGVCGLWAIYASAGWKWLAAAAAVLAGLLAWSCFMVEEAALGLGFLDTVSGALAIMLMLTCWAAWLHYWYEKKLSGGVDEAGDGVQSSEAAPSANQEEEPAEPDQNGGQACEASLASDQEEDGDELVESADPDADSPSDSIRSNEVAPNANQVEEPDDPALAAEPDRDTDADGADDELGADGARSSEPAPSAEQVEETAEPDENGSQACEANPSSGREEDPALADEPDEDGSQACEASLASDQAGATDDPEHIAWFDFETGSELEPEPLSQEEPTARTWRFPWQK